MAVIYGTTLEHIIRRERVLVLLSLFLISVLAWMYTITLSAGLKSVMVGTTMGNIVLPYITGLGTMDLYVLFIVWPVIALSITLPAAAPIAVLFSTISRRRFSYKGAVLPAFILVLGFMSVWIGFALLAATLQFLLHCMSLMTGNMESNSGLLSGLIMTFVGLYQWTPLKWNCLMQCRSPLMFLMTKWRVGAGGTFVMGLEQGLYSVGSSFLLLTLLYVGGVLSIFWIALITLIIMGEKLAPAPVGPILSRVTGALLFLIGFWMVWSEVPSMTS
jgi:predicted metal-binding membrane protein